MELWKGFMSYATKILLCKLGKTHQILNESKGKKKSGLVLVEWPQKMNAFSLCCLWEAREVVIPVSFPRRLYLWFLGLIDCILHNVWFCSLVLVNSVFTFFSITSFGSIKIYTPLSLLLLFYWGLCYWCCRKEGFLPVPITVVFINGPSLPCPEESALKPLYISTWMW